MFDFDLLPAHIRSGAREYIEHGLPPGHFLTAVIKNNLTEAFARADEINRPRLYEILSFFYNEAPAPCWGSTDKLDAWVAHNGLAGPEDGDDDD